eukprot:TRINITY_DN116138_c0_g1_i1.p2 TRINITY_DN116138_c0_g1~~TRINITY_DN116138_c0_g1_i1.p2  ORF type:complete len:101 (-),score=6.80 TRINITY_DN116138_c0_g1_i1:380-682(-)
MSPTGTTPCPRKMASPVLAVVNAEEWRGTGGAFLSRVSTTMTSSSGEGTVVIARPFKDGMAANSARTSPCRSEMDREAAPVLLAAEVGTDNRRNTLMGGA